MPRPKPRGLPSEARQAQIRERRMERETGIEPATNSLEGCDSTTELLPPTFANRSLRSQLRWASPPHSPRSLHLPRLLSRPGSSSCLFPWLANRSCARSARLAKVGGEGRIRTFEAAGATDLQSVAFDRFATSPESALDTASRRHLLLVRLLSPPRERLTDRHQLGTIEVP